MRMQIRSSAFEHGGNIPVKYTCDGENINPPLEFIDVPHNARSLALIVEDPDVPTSIRADGMWVHWLICNIPPETKVVGEGETPVGISGMTTSGENKYGGPCPPNGTHRYFFKLSALSRALTLQEGSSKSALLETMEKYVLETAELMGKYERP